MATLPSKDQILELTTQNYRASTIITVINVGHLYMEPLIQSCPAYNVAHMYNSPTQWWSEIKRLCNQFSRFFTF